MNRNMLVFLLSSLPLAAAETNVELDSSRTSIAFALGDVLHTVHGTFKLRRGTVIPPRAPPPER